MKVKGTSISSRESGRCWLAQGALGRQGVWAGGGSRAEQGGLTQDSAGVEIAINDKTLAARGGWIPRAEEGVGGEVMTRDLSDWGGGPEGRTAHQGSVAKRSRDTGRGARRPPCSPNYRGGGEAGPGWGDGSFIFGLVEPETLEEHKRQVNALGSEWRSRPEGVGGHRGCGQSPGHSGVWTPGEDGEGAAAEGRKPARWSGCQGLRWRRMAQRRHAG